ncbi:MAG: hypothetical protein HY303_15815, partial [Candidatus Wallbacteria bacterium]|nr:hypothetical protein [Candidatus Wallbacteria bacterium]
MLIRKVTAPTRQEAYDKLRKELGPDVEVVHVAAHKRGGIFGRWFCKEWIEIVGVRTDRSGGDAKSHPTVQAAVKLTSAGLAEISSS